VPKSKSAKSAKLLKTKPPVPISVKRYEPPDHEKPSADPEKPSADPEKPSAEARKWRNRIVGHDEVDANSLLANPKNWRIHPKNQVDALAGS
jgi:hypothetical protein